MSITEATPDERRESRRSVLKKGAVAAAAAWAAPAIASSPAFASGTLGSNQCKCCDPVTKTFGKPQGGVQTLTYRYRPDLYQAPAAPFSTCEPVALSNTVNVVGGYQNTSPVKVYVYTNGGGSTCAMGAESPINGVTGGVVVSSGGTFSFPVSASGGTGNNYTVKITTADGATTLQRVCYHASCSQPLCTQDRHGPLVVDSYTVGGTCKPRKYDGVFVPCTP